MVCNLEPPAVLVQVCRGVTCSFLRQVKGNGRRSRATDPSICGRLVQHVVTRCSQHPISSASPSLQVMLQFVDPSIGVRLAQRVVTRRLPVVSSPFQPPRPSPVARGPTLQVMLQFVAASIGVRLAQRVVTRRLPVVSSSLNL